MKTGSVVSECFSEWSQFVDSSVLRGVIFPDVIDGSLKVSSCQRITARRFALCAIVKIRLVCTFLLTAQM